MKKTIRWEHANKLAIIFGIIGGVYLIFQLTIVVTSEKLKFNSEITINDFNYPQDNNHSFGMQARAIIPSSFDSYDLSKKIVDSLYNNFDLSKYYSFTIRENIENEFPKELDRDYLVHKIDSLVLRETYPLRKTKYYIESFLKNKGDKIAKELRFEIPIEGYYELFVNESMVEYGDFQNNIFLNELRPENTVKLRIWSFGYVSDYSVLYSKEIRYTFNGGSIVPTALESIQTKGFFYWIYKNPIWAAYLLIFLPINLTLELMFRFMNKNEAPKPLKKKKVTPKNDS